MAPAVLLTVMLGVIPLLALLCFSFFDWSLTRADSGSFIGLSNYLTVAGDPDFWHAVGVSVEIAVETILLQLVLGISIALLLNHNLPGMGIIRAFVMAPMMLAPLFAGLIWRLVLSSDFGVLPYLLTFVGIDEPPVLLSDPFWAVQSVVLVATWQTTPFVVLFVIAALQIIPNELYEAGRLDGASAPRLFWSITLPIIRPVLLIIVLFSIIDSVKIFDPIYALTTGGPGGATESLSYLIYLETSTFFNMGYGSAMAVITLVLVAIPVLLILRTNVRLGTTAAKAEAK